jgi:hypothetical protein
MTITKCDICKKVIKKEDTEFSMVMLAGSALYSRTTICLRCGKPVEAIFKKHNLGDC